MSDTTRRTPSETEAEIGELKRQLDAAAQGTVQRIEGNPQNIERDLAKLVLGLIELLRRLLERQAIRRMEGGSLTDAQLENMGESLMKLEQKIVDLSAAFGLKPEDLNLELGPLGNLLDK